MKTAQLVAAAAAFLNDRPTFKPGQLVVWNCAELKTKKYPHIGQPAVVLQQMDTPVIDDSLDAGDLEYGSPLDLRIAVPVASNDGHAVVSFVIDSRRFRLATEAEVQAWDKKAEEQAKEDERLERSDMPAGILGALLGGIAAKASRSSDDGSDEKGPVH